MLVSNSSENLPSQRQLDKKPYACAKIALLVSGLILVGGGIGCYFEYSTLLGIVSMGTGGAMILASCLWSLRDYLKEELEVDEPAPVVFPIAEKTSDRVKEWLANSKKNLPQVTEALVDCELPLPRPLINLIAQYGQGNLDVFDADKWKSFFPDLEILDNNPYLPDRVIDLMEGPCPFWPEKTMMETHALLLIPGDHHFSEFTRRLKESSDRFYIMRGEQENLWYLPSNIAGTNMAARWTIVTKEIVPGSLNKSFLQQTTLIAEKNIRLMNDRIAYRHLTDLEAVWAISLMSISGIADDSFLIGNKGATFTFNRGVFVYRIYLEAKGLLVIFRDRKDTHFEDTGCALVAKL